MSVVKPVEMIHRQMWGTLLEQTAALYFGLILPHLVGGTLVTSYPTSGWNMSGIQVMVLGQPGDPVTLPCSYHYEDQTHIPQLSVEWKSPNNELLCYYIKHKSFKNCTDGYNISYSPGSISLSVQSVKAADYGKHACTVYKPHEFSDYSVLLSQSALVTPHPNRGWNMSDFVSPDPNRGWNMSGRAWTLLLLHSVWLFVCM